MRFKSVRFWSGIGRSCLLGALLVALSPNAFAVITVTLANPTTVGLSGSSGSVPAFYFPATGGNATPPAPVSSPVPLNGTLISSITQPVIALNDGGANINQLQFTVISTQSFTGG